MVEEKKLLVVSVETLVSARTREPLVQITCPELRFQLDIESAEELGINILQAAAAAKADVFLFRFAIDKLGGSPEMAAQLLNEFRIFQGTPVADADQVPIAFEEVSNG